MPGVSKGSGQEKTVVQTQSFPCVVLWPCPRLFLALFVGSSKPIYAHHLPHCRVFHPVFMSS
jgi:hypothetical protein